MLSGVFRVPTPRVSKIEVQLLASMETGRSLSSFLKSKLTGKNLAEFQYTSKGSLASLGSRDGVGKIFFITVKGFLAWLIWRAFYLSFLPTL